jgi:ABC-type polysaccharide/polyol phosphate export permease
VAGVVNLLLALVPLLVILLATGHPLRPALLFLPISILITGTFTLGVALLVSPLAVFFADVVELIVVVLTLLLYTTPVFYPASIVPVRFDWVMRFNPLHWLLDVFRMPIYDGALPPVKPLAAAVLLAVALLWIGALFFRRLSDRIPFHV